MQLDFMFSMRVKTKLNVFSLIHTLGWIRDATNKLGNLF